MISDIEPAPLSVTEARVLTDHLKQALEVSWDLMAAAFRGRVWLALGWDSWDTYCQREFGAGRLQLPREERTEVIGSLRAAGLSTRAIASAIGVNQSTVVRTGLSSGDAFASPDDSGTLTEDEWYEQADSAADEDDDEDYEPSPPPRVIGVDGKSYARPLRTVAELIDAHNPDARSERERANLKAQYSKAMARVGWLTSLNVDAVASVLSGSEAAMCGAAALSLSNWANRVDRARHNKGFRVVEDGM